VSSDEFSFNILKERMIAEIRDYLRTNPLELELLRLYVDFDYPINGHLMRELSGSLFLD